MVCTNAITTVVKTKDSSGIDIVLVLNVKDVSVEVSNAAELATEFVLEEDL